MNKWIEVSWLSVLAILAARESYAIIANRETLSQSIWNAERTPYGLALCCVAGIFAGHLFFRSKLTAVAFIVGSVIGTLWFSF